MAKALECPACGAKHRLDGIDPGDTFRCDRCGQKLKIPAAGSNGSPASTMADAADDPRPGDETSTPIGTVPPPPPRRASSSRATEVIGASAATLAVDENGVDPPTADDRRGTRPATAPRRRVKWYWRLLAWVVAVPLGFVLTAWPAYELGLIRKNDVLDVFVGSGTDRYTRLAIVTLLWALVTAILVQLLVEGGRVWADRRRRRRAATLRTRGRTRGRPRSRTRSGPDPAPAPPPTGRAPTKG
jgi:hypothetical protein